MGREETLPSPHDPRASQSLLENNIPILPTHHFPTSTYFDSILWDCRKVVGEWREIEVTRGGGRVRKKRRVRKERTTSCLPIPSLFFFLLTSLCAIPTRWTPTKGQFLRCTPSSPCLQALRGTVMYQAGIVGDRVWLWGFYAVWYVLLW